MRFCSLRAANRRFDAPLREVLRIKFLVFLLFWAALPSYPQSDLFPAARDAAVAGRYAQWAKTAIDEGRWKEALAALERASDFADVSSDISYLLALARSHEDIPRAAVLEALNMAFSTDNWVLCREEDARLLRIENLIAIRAYQEALSELSRVSKGPKEATLTLRILAASRPADFRSFMKETLDRYPRECEPVRLFLAFLKNMDAAGTNPGSEDLELLEFIIRRLPLLTPDDAELAWMAAPFIRDTEEAKRLVMAYRAANVPRVESLPAALKLGVISEETALEELFAPAALPLGIALLEEVWALLRREELRAQFRRNLSVYSGVLIEDADRDGIPETYAEYFEGMLTKSTYNKVQDGISELTVFFEAGVAQRALALIPPEGGASGVSSRKEARVQWERYPAVLEVELEGAVFIPRPLDLHFSPVLFTELWGSGLLFPRRDAISPPLTRRALVSQSLRVERPSLEFRGGIEVVELNQGIPVRAREYVGDMMVSETDFLRGRPLFQRVDLDFDGRMETARRFSRNYRDMEIEELWDYDREFDYIIGIGE